MTNFHGTILIGALSGCLLLANAAYAVYTNQAMEAETPTANFTFNVDGTVVDKATGLMWQRCPVGTVYSNNGTPANYLDDQCNGSNATLTWMAALQYAQTVNASGLNGYNDWRIPNLPETKSIIEHRNYDPAINVEVFPGYNSMAYWTSTPSMYPGYENSSTAVDFTTADDLWPSRKEGLFVRLVRTAN